LQAAAALRHAGRMIALFTDFGLHGHYTGQLKAVLHQRSELVRLVYVFLFEWLSIW
jgi:hypothetical protein